MSKIVQLNEFKKYNDQWVCGHAVCLDCKKEWVAVSNGAIWLECPGCGLIRGRFKYQFERDGHELICGCGNDLFYCKLEGIYCPNCGEWQYFQ